VHYAIPFFLILLLNALNVVDNCSMCRSDICVERKSKGNEYCYKDDNCSGASGKSSLQKSNFNATTFQDLILITCSVTFI
jgi:hypothetical protein